MSRDERLAKKLQEQKRPKRSSIVFDVLIAIERKKLHQRWLKLWPLVLLALAVLLYEIIHTALPNELQLPSSIVIMLCLVGTVATIAYLSR
jgi:hypothetical protein